MSVSRQRDLRDHFEVAIRKEHPWMDFTLDNGRYAHAMVERLWQQWLRFAAVEMPTQGAA